MLLMIQPKAKVRLPVPFSRPEPAQRQQRQRSDASYSCTTGSLQSCNGAERAHDDGKGFNVDLIGLPGGGRRAIRVRKEATG
ncbi:hypothetical protein LRP30_33530 [Bradyrhizobium sp. C-145]|uniref:hypothetical protein n=1 Tax=Bradyrhizobium sp. C-145 TaxID=574727 RepID=UPI00201B50EB|nr:hypothetical protein [Bradyrhizobium sp. C-145]UQR61700.1 hypothetical protein LRP30_33530 [Bradyrhizobium sp. C-145]